jgi:hypothetical protein
MRIQLFTLMLIQIRILLLMLIKGIGISTGLWTLQGSILNTLGPPRLCFEPVKLLKYDFNTEPVPDFRCYADPDPACKNNADPQPWFLEKECSNTATGIAIYISS